MRDWELAVSERMGRLRLCTEARSDVVRELACHFEQIYDDARERGAGEQDAREEALESVRDWRRFTHEVQREKESLMTTTPFRKKVVLPGMVALVFSGIALWVTSMLHHAGAQYVFHPVDPKHYFTFNIPWLIALPIVGAIGAWMSWRNGGNSAQRFYAGIFPTLTFAWVPLWGAAIAVIWIVANNVVPQRISDHASAAEWTVRIISFLVPWVLAPAIAMAVGTLPFLWLKAPVMEERPASAAHA